MFAFSITAPRLRLRPCRRARPADEVAPARSPALAGAVDAPPLSAALIATGLAIAILAGGYRFSRLVESRYIHALAPQLEDLKDDAPTYGLPDLMLKNQGLALQAEALRQPDLLPIYGSSELIRRVSQGPYHPGELFRRYPTGFTVFAVGRPGASPLITLQDLAALGPELRGRRLVISLSPSFFIEADGVDPGYYHGNFSRLHANELVFNSDLSFGLKQDAARRMLRFPKTLTDDPLLRFGLERLASGSPFDVALYYGALPLGRLQSLLLELQDHWQVLHFMRRHPGLSPDVPREAADLDWSGVQSRADAESRQRSEGNPYGFDDELWNAFSPRLLAERGRRTEADFLRRVQAGEAWTDLELLLRGLRELGARPLLVGQPMKGPFFDFLGIPYSARRAYYSKLELVARRYEVPLVDFAEHDEDRDFVASLSSHLSPKGWVSTDRVLDDFYHGLGPQP